MKEEKLINRPGYLEKLQKWSQDPEMIKIVTGVRRCGKSKLFTLMQRNLIATGVSPTQIHQIDLDLDENQRFLDREVLYKHILDNLVPDKMNYVFLDEIQLVADWQKTANSLRAKKNIDLYLTGSNAYMFSSKLSTLIGGRYIEIKMQPLSFREYLAGMEEVIGEQSQKYKAQFGRAVVGEIKFAPDLNKEYQKYITESGFPQTIKYNGDMNLINDYLRDSVYQNTINKDIVLRFNLKEPSKLNAVVKYLFDNTGKETSILSIEKALKGMVSNDSINKYVEGLLDSYLLYKCEKMDLKGKQILNSSPKYYVCDAGLRSVVLERRGGDIGRILENVVYLELLRRGYDINVGKIKKLENGKWKEIEVDFVATKAGGVTEYYQVSSSIAIEDVFNREMTSLEQIKDNYPKYLLTMDYGSDGRNGIKRLNVLDWLLDKMG